MKMGHNQHNMVYKWEMQPFMVLYGCTHIYIICNDRIYHKPCNINGDEWARKVRD